MADQVLHDPDVAVPGVTYSFSPRDLVLAEPWSAALFTTFSLSLSFFEAIPFADMSRSASSVTVVTDIAGYATSLADAGAVDVGRNYDLVPVSVAGGVFHPKIGVLSGKDGLVRAMIGSGNLTFGGWGYNAEVFEVLVPGTDSHAYEDLAGFLEALQELMRAGGRLTTHRRPDFSRYIDDCRNAARRPGDGSSRVLHTLAGPLDAQIADVARDLGGAQAVTVVSPFFGGHHGVARLAAALECDEISVSVSPRSPECFDFAGARAAGLDAKPVMSELFNGSRSLHAKAFDLECRRGRLVVSGSANATLPAIGGHNVEAVLARIIDRAVSLGWMPSGTISGAVDTQLPDQAVPGPCLAAKYEQGKLVGQMFAVPSPAGEWRAVLRYGTQAKALDGMVTVRADGAFQLATGEFDPTTISSSAQLCLERDGTEVRGWLMQQDLLDAVREKGPIARVVQRLLSGGSGADAIAMLEYLARSPTEFLEAAQRGSSIRAPRRPPTEAAGAKVRADGPAPSAFQNSSGWTGGVGGGAFATLMDALVRRWQSVLPEAEEEEEEEDGEEISASTPRRARGGGARRSSKPPAPTFKAAFDKIASCLQAMPAGADRIPGMHLLFDMTVSIAPRCEDGGALTLSCLREWITLALDVPKRAVFPDALDKAIAATLTMLTMDGASAVECHAKLQQICGGEPDGAAIELLKPDPGGVDELRLAPGGSPEQWESAWTTMLGAVTTWTRMNALERAIRTGSPWEPPECATKTEVALLRRVAAGSSRPDRLCVCRDAKNGDGACPACHMRLTPGEQDRLRLNRMGTCTSCERVIFRLGL